MSDDEIIELLTSKGIHKRTPEEAEADEEFESWETPAGDTPGDHQEL